MGLISLKRHIEKQPPETVAALNSLRDLLRVTGDSLDASIPALGLEVGARMGVAISELEGCPNPETILRAKDGAVRQLRRWSDGAKDYLKSKTDEIKEIVITLAKLGDAVGDRDSRFFGQFSCLAAKIGDIAAMDDLSAVRKCLTASAQEMSVCITKMKEEGESTLREMQAQIETYRAKLEETEKLALLDPLTGLANRLAIEREITGRRNRKQLFSVIMLDLNGFKTVNDRHGHVVGDELLRLFGSELRQQFRTGDVVSRWGGDEFVIVVDGNADGSGESYRERLRRWTFGEYKVNTSNGQVRVQVDAGVGVAVWDGIEGVSELLGRVDTLMFTDKRLSI